MSRDAVAYGELPPVCAITDRDRVRSHTVPLITGDCRRPAVLARAVLRQVLFLGSGTEHEQIAFAMVPIFDARAFACRRLGWLGPLLVLASVCLSILLLFVFSGASAVLAFFLGAPVLIGLAFWQWGRLWCRHGVLVVGGSPTHLHLDVPSTEACRRWSEHGDAAG